MKTLTWQKPGQQNVAQELIKIIINYVAELRGNTFVVNAGPYVGFGLGGKATVESGGAEVGTKLFKKIDGADEALMNRCAVGLQYGVGFELGYKYLLNLTGQYGFTNMFKKSLTQENNKNLAFMITVGYRF